MPLGEDWRRWSGPDEVVRFNLRKSDEIKRALTLRLSGRVALNRWTDSNGEEGERLQIITDSVASASTVRPGGRKRQSTGTQTDGGAPFDHEVEL